MGPRAFVACAVSGLALVLAGCSDEPDDEVPLTGSGTVTIYSSLPMHGRDRASSLDMLDAIKLALKDAGGKAGLLEVNFVSLDSSTREAGAWTSDRVLDNAREAIRDINAIAYIGDRDSAATALSLPLTNEAGILQVSPTSSYDGLTRPGGVRTGEPERFYPSGTHTFGRMVPPDHVQASALVSYMKAEGVDKLAILGDRELVGGGIAEQVSAAARRSGVEVVDAGRIDPSKGDFSADAARVAASGADAFLFAGSSATGAARIFRAVAGVTTRMLLFAPDAVTDEGMYQALGAAVQRRMRITTPNLPLRELPAAARALFKRFRAAFGRRPAPEALQAYEATQAILGSIRAAGKEGNQKDAVIKAFFDIKDRHSVLGTYSIDGYGDTSLDRFAGDRLSGSRLVLDRVLEVKP